MDFAEEALGTLGDDHFYGVGYVLRGENLSGIFWAAGGAAGKTGGYTARADDADANAVLAEVFGHAGGKALKAPFGGAIDAAAGKGIATGERADVDDVAGAALDHRGDDRARNKKNALEVCVKDTVPIGFGFFVGWAEEADAGVIDKDGDRAKRGLSLVHEGGHVSRVRDVSELRVEGRAGFFQLSLGRGERLCIAATDRNAGAEFGKSERDGSTDAPIATGDKRNCSEER